MKIILLHDLSTWPLDVLEYLETHHDLFLNWELRNGKTRASDSDQAIYNLRRILRGDYTIHGYHCTRLADAEIQIIINGGMSLPNLDTLIERIRTVQSIGLLNADMADYLIGNNQADESNRAGMIWFCFFPPHYARQSGIERFFRSWGGEALYNSHERNPLLGAVLHGIGTPCIVEANVPVASLAYHGGLDFKMIRRFLVNRGFKTVEDLDHEDSARSAIPAANIIRVIRYPDPEFIALTKCNQWRPPL